MEFLLIGVLRTALLKFVNNTPPHWKIRNSKVLEFDAIQVDHEVMDIEKEVTGWKMTLNTTEFLCCRDKVDFFLLLMI